MAIRMQNLSSQARGVKRIIRHMKHHQKLFQQAANTIAREIPLVKWRLAKARADLQNTRVKR